MSIRLAGFPVSFAYDSNCSLSLVSTNFAIVHNLPVISARCLIAVSMATPAAWSTFTSDLEFEVVSGLKVDACFGRDWLGLCKAMAIETTALLVDRRDENVVMTNTPSIYASVLSSESSVNEGPLATKDVFVHSEVSFRSSSDNEHPMVDVSCNESAFLGSSLANEGPSSMGGTVQLRDFCGDEEICFPAAANTFENRDITMHEKNDKDEFLSSVGNSAVLETISEHVVELLRTILIRGFSTGIRASAFCNDEKAL